MKDAMDQWCDKFPPLNLYNWSIIYYVRDCVSDKYTISGNHYASKFDSDTNEYPVQPNTG